MSTTPLKVALFIALVLLGMLGLTFLAGDNGFRIGPIRLDYPTTEKFLTPARRSHSPATDSLILALEEEERQIREDSLRIIKPCDTCPAPGLSQAPRGFYFDTADTETIIRLDMPEQDPEVLHGFFRELESAATKKKKIRIVHYGDSQIEGDRITAYIRQRMQSAFGGNGPGFLPLFPVYEQIAAVIQPSPNWQRFAAFDPAMAKLPNRKFGLFMSFSRFTPAEADSMDTEPAAHTAWVEVGRSTKAMGNARNFKQVALHYGNLHTPLLMEVFDNDSLIVSDTLIRDGEYHAYTLNFDRTPERLRYVFSGSSSADFYGLTLDGGYGLGVDNVAMRGATGTHFYSTDAALNTAMAKSLHTRLIILQYGGNAVPYLTDENSIATYIRQLKSQIRTMRKWNPELTFIFIGPADMSTRTDGEFQTYSLLEPLITALRQMCLESGIPYWDTYRAMGGYNSMPAWVERGLAARDYVHYSNRGTRIIAEQFVKALFAEYQQYKTGSM